MDSNVARSDLDATIVAYITALHDDFLESHGRVHDLFVKSHEREHALSEEAHTAAKELNAKRLDEVARTIQERYDTILTERDKAVQAAFASSEKAILKAEISIEKRADATYVALGELQRLLGGLMPRMEAEQRINAVANGLSALDERNRISLAAIGTRLDFAQGKSGGLAAGWGYLVGAIVLAGTLITIVLALTSK